MDMNSKEVLIVDYGLGNLLNVPSVMKADKQEPRSLL